MMLPEAGGVVATTSAALCPPSGGFKGLTQGYDTTRYLTRLAPCWLGSGS